LLRNRTGLRRARRRGLGAPQLSGEVDFVPGAAQRFALPHRVLKLHANGPSGSSGIVPAIRVFARLAKRPGMTGQLYDAWYCGRQLILRIGAPEPGLT